MLIMSTIGICIEKSKYNIMVDSKNKQEDHIRFLNSLKIRGYFTPASLLLLFQVNICNVTKGVGNEGTSLPFDPW